MNITSTLGTLKLLAILEGISYISFALTMPLKYIYEIKAPNYYVGIIHGALFMMYTLYVFVNHFKFKWEFKKTALLLVASIVPFMTFWADAKLLKEEN